MKNLSILVSGVIMVGALAVTYWSTTAPEAPKHARVTPARAAVSVQQDERKAPSAGVETELASLKGQVAALRNGLLEQRAVEQKAEDDAPQLTIQEQRALASKAWQEHMAEVAVAFAKEPVDHRWASETSEVLTAAIKDDPVLAGAVGAIECRSRSCRVELTNDRSGNLDKQMPVFAQSVGGTLQNIEAQQVDNGDGQAKMVLFMNNQHAEEPVAAK